MSDYCVRWWEIASSDAEQTVPFMEKVLGLKMEFDEASGIWCLPFTEEMTGFNGGGAFTLKQGKEPHITVYFRTDDVDAVAERVVKHGGTIHEAPFNIFEKTRICLFKDPTGLILAVIGPPK